VTEKDPPPAVPYEMTWGWRKRQAEIDAQRMVYLGGGLAGLGLFGAGDMGANIFNEVQVLRALFVVFALITAAFLGLAWAADTAEVTKIEKQKYDLTAHTGGTELPPLPSRPFRRVAVLLLLATSLIFVAASIVAAIRSDDSSADVSPGVSPPGSTRQHS
jgi:hypothetical protein